MMIMMMLRAMAQLNLEGITPIYNSIFAIKCQEEDYFMTDEFDNFVIN